VSVRLVLADDHWVVLQGLRALLDLEDDLEVVATCVDGIEAEEAVAEHDPDVLITDATMPRQGGVETLEKLRADGSATRILILTASLDDDMLSRCVQAEVDGIVLKESAATALLDAVRTVGRGERWLSPTLANRVLQLGSSEDPGGGLTAREMEVARLVAEGRSNKKAAFELGISESTLKLHLHRVFNKLGVRNRVQLSILARERGWV
jgi:DNA-binding NarL/FixJ family response regulator